MEYSLYWYPGSCARMPFVALEELGAPFDVVVEDRAANRAGYLEINQKNQVPALVTPDGIITENVAIQVYLARRHPEAHLLPIDDRVTEIRVLEMLSWFASSVHPSARQQRFPMFYSEDPDAHESVRANARAKLRTAFSLIERRLGDGDWLFDDWSLVDVHLLWLWFRATGSGLDGTEFPRCIAHAARCEARPSVAKVLERENAEFAKLRDEGKIPGYMSREFQVGYAPAFS